MEFKMDCYIMPLWLNLWVEYALFNSVLPVPNQMLYYCGGAKGVVGDEDGNGQIIF